MNKEQLKRGISSLRSLASECYFLSTPINPLAAVNDSLVNAQQISSAAPIARRTATTLCEQARHACRMVDVAASRNPQAWKGPILPPAPSNVNEEVLRMAMKIAAEKERDKWG